MNEENKYTLLERAKKTEVSGKYNIIITDDDIELAFAWLRDEISLSQAAAAYDIKTNNYRAMYRFAKSLKQAFKNGRLQIVSHE